MVACSGSGKNGSLVVIQERIRNDLLTSFPLPGYYHAWSVRQADQPISRKRGSRNEGGVEVWRIFKLKVQVEEIELKKEMEKGVFGERREFKLKKFIKDYGGNLMWYENSSWENMVQDETWSWIFKLKVLATIRQVLGCHKDFWNNRLRMARRKSRRGKPFSSWIFNLNHNCIFNLKIPNS